MSKPENKTGLPLFHLGITRPEELAPLFADLRGRFDYASLNSSAASVVEPRGEGSAALPADTAGMNYQMLAPAELDQVDRFSILLLSEKHGVEVREAAPPTQ